MRNRFRINIKYYRLHVLCESGNLDEWYGRKSAIHKGHQRCDGGGMTVPPERIIAFNFQVLRCL